MHTCASWHGNQCCLTKFSTLLHENIIFHFLNVKFGAFCEASTKNMLKNCNNIFYKNIRTHFRYKITNWLHLTDFYPPLAKKTNFCRSSWKLRTLNYMCFIVCPRFFLKIIFRFTSCYFIRDMLRVPSDSTPSNMGHAHRFDRILKST